MYKPILVRVRGSISNSILHKCGRVITRTWKGVKPLDLKFTISDLPACVMMRNGYLILIKNNLIGIAPIDTQ